MVTPLSFTEERVLNFFRFVAQRHLVFVKRIIWRQPAPWTEDPVLAEVYLCNAYWELDRLSRFLITTILPHAKTAPIGTLFRVLTFRSFNWIPTYQALNGFEPADRWDPQAALAQLREREQAGHKIFTGAFRFSQRGYPDGTSKVEIAVDRLTAIHRQLPTLYEDLMRAKSMPAAYRRLCELPGVGDFLGYVLVADLCYNRALLPFGEDDWTVAGLGAMEGLKILAPAVNVTPSVAPQLIGELRRDQTSWLNEADVRLLGPELTLRNIEHCLCEFQKYWRAKHDPDARPKRRFRPEQANGDLSLWDDLPPQFVVPRRTPLIPRPDRT